MPPLSADVCVLCESRPGPSENCAKKIAEFLGANVSFVPVSGQRIDSIRELIPADAVLIAHVDLLAKVAATAAGDVCSLIDSGAGAFIYGFAPMMHAAFLRTLSAGALLGVEATAEAANAFLVADDQREWSGPFTGLSVSGVDRTRDHAFVEGKLSIGQKVLIRSGSQPFLVRIERGGSQLFLAATGGLADLDELADSRTGMLPWFSRLIPLLMFLKKSLGNRAWHADRAQACFIIDDPLLTPNYGFFNYRKLLEAARGQKFSSSIAFIPWNYRRSHKKVARLFSMDRRKLSLCVHGCDHTRAEFALANVDVLRGKARLALDRMHAHQERSGVPFDDVMVFPQGLFSVEAIEALAGCRYLAAVNTNLCPSDKPQVLPLRNLMDVAVADFADIALFGRHYPTDLAPFAFDLFLGKPALAVAHHDYFSKGYEPLMSFIKRLNGLDSNLEWDGLAAVCTRAHVRKTAPDGKVHMRFFTDHFYFRNNDDKPHRYILQKHLTAGRSVGVNGIKWETEELDGRLRFSVDLEPGQAADIRIEPEVETAVPSWKPSMTHRVSVLVRRLLCEFRDNYVETNLLLHNFLVNLRLLQTKEKQFVGLFRARELKAAPKSV
jgi:hypothetical protein